MSTSTLDDPEARILARVIGGQGAALLPEVAREFLAWSFSEFDRQRMSQLAEKARAGVLTPEERAETEGYERVDSFLGIVKSRARRSLRVQPGE